MQLSVWGRASSAYRLIDLPAVQVEAGAQMNDIIEAGASEESSGVRFFSDQPQVYSLKKLRLMSMVVLTLHPHHAAITIDG